MKILVLYNIGDFMINVKRCLIENEITYRGNVIVRYSIEYPQICSNCFNVSKFNSVNYNKAMELEDYAKNEFFQEAMDLFDYNCSNGYPIVVLELVSKLNVTYNNESIISLYQDEYVYEGGAHGITTRTSQTWDLRCSRMLTLNDICKNNPNYILCILREINRQVKCKGEENFFDNYCSLILETFNPNQFYIIPKCVVIYFQEYDIAPYSTGITEFCV